jgi:hypothetical protein
MLHSREPPMLNALGHTFLALSTQDAGDLRSSDCSDRSVEQYNRRWCHRAGHGLARRAPDDPLWLLVIDLSFGQHTLQLSRVRR